MQHRHLSSRRRLFAGYHFQGPYELRQLAGSQTRAPSCRLVAMTVDLTDAIETELRGIAAKQGRSVGALVDEAIRTYIEAAAITDLEPAQIAEAQVALLAELGELSEWKDGDE